jgi:hypothetical protein
MVASSVQSVANREGRSPVVFHAWMGPPNARFEGEFSWSVGRKPPMSCRRDGRAREARRAKMREPERALNVPTVIEQSLIQRYERCHPARLARRYAGIAGHSLFA